MAIINGSREWKKCASELWGRAPYLAIPVRARLLCAHAASALGEGLVSDENERSGWDEAHKSILVRRRPWLARLVSRREVIPDVGQKIPRSH
jgi:hypothetical protein